MKAWLGLGSNQHQPVKQLVKALTKLDETPGISVLQKSCLYRTPPWGDEQQDEFINAVVQVETGLDPMSLLKALQSIEDNMGRTRTDRRWGPRIIDIDLLLFGRHIHHETELEIPHPRMHERAFVLLPLSTLDRALEVPGHGMVNALLQHLDCSGITKLINDDWESNTN